MPTLVKMPKWGLTMKVGTITDWLRPEGAEVTAGEPLLSVETDKAANDVEAPASGMLRKVVAAVGEEVPVSDPVAVIAAPGETLSDDEVAALVAEARRPTAAARAGVAGAERAARASSSATQDETGRVTASPAARKRAHELGIDLAMVAATGPGGRVTSDDVERAAAALREDAATLPDGRRLSYVLAGPAHRPPPIVLLHGLGGSQSSWQVVFSALAERHRVCALDLPGHGASDKTAPDQADYTLPGLGAAVAGALQTLHLAPAILVGHSLGGAVALQIALEHPSLVDRLVLVDSAGLGHEVNPELLDRVEAEPSRDEARRLLELFFHDQRHILDSGVDDLHRQRIDAAGRAAVGAAAAASFDRAGQRVDLRPRLGEIQAPLLVVWGAEDRVFPSDQARAVATAQPAARVEVFDGVGHVPQVEAGDRFVTLIERFMEEPA